MTLTFFMIFIELRVEKTSIIVVAGSLTQARARSQQQEAQDRARGVGVYLRRVFFLHRVKLSRDDVALSTALHIMINKQNKISQSCQALLI